MSNPPFTVKALFEYTSDHEDDLTLSIGQIVTVTEVEDEGWYFGEYTDESGTKREGIFPQNFVEKYEPPAPPRPSRPHRAKKEPEPAAPTQTAAPAAPTPDVPSGRGSLDTEGPDTADAAPQSHAVAESRSGPVETPAPTAPTAPAQPPPVEEKVESTPKPAPKPGPPPVAEKPTGSSFKDRIAAFNKPAAAPVTPFNPNKPTTSDSFIKKSFVAPPPSKHAYVPPSQTSQPPPKVYRREEDPEIQERVAQDQAMAERAEHQTTTAAGQESDEDQPQPTSLKDKIALLQKQQLEQAARNAEAAQKKEKPKKPVKKPAEPESQEPTGRGSSQVPELERTKTSESIETSTEVGQQDEVGEQNAHESHVTPLVKSPSQPPRELTSDTNDADSSGAGDTEEAEAEETSTSKEDLSDAPRDRRQSIPIREKAEPSHPVDHAEQSAGNEERNEGTEEDGEEKEEEEETDPEVKRRMEIRDRMAKMSGGMGMMGMFGPPGGMPGMAPPQRKPKPQPSGEPGRKSSEEDRPAPTTKAPPVPVMGLPGMQAKGQEPTSPDVEAEDKVALTPVPSTQQQAAGAPHPNKSKAPPPPPSTSQGADSSETPRPVPPPPVPGDRPVPPRPATEPQTVSVPHSGTNMSPTMDDESDDERPAVSDQPERSHDVPTSSRDEPQHLQDSSSIGTGAPQAPSSPPTEKRYSRGPPPPPPTMPAPAHNRPPPPPPPVPATRSSTGDSRASATPHAQLHKDENEEEITEYEGDYDTDIASGAKHKDALKAHGRDSSLDEGTMADDFNAQSPSSPPQARPPIPSATIPRAAPPPPPPAQPPKQPRKSADMPRAPPPPVPPPKTSSESTGHAGDDEYDPFRYDAPAAPGRGDARATVTKTPSDETQEYELYSASPPQRSAPSAAPPPPPPERTPAPPPPPPQSPPLPAPGSQPRQSMDMLKPSGSARKSTDAPRPSMDQGYIASDVDLAESTQWWTQPNTPPPAFQNRRDILVEIEESPSSKRSGKTAISKDVYILFMDYSQTVISVQFDSRNPGEANLEQRSEPPPARLRQDQLEDAHMQFGSRIADAVTSKQNTTVGDGTPQSLIQSLLTPLPDAIHSVGMRAYGALVYANLANASVQQFDEIRAGDIVSFRNARFQGHRGTMHQKYNMEAGKPDHVAIVVDWDGTKKKIRAWEQGRESKKVKMESFKLGDLRSGECRVWRVMPRSWVGWEGGDKA